MWQEVFDTWSAKTRWRVPPAWLLSLGCHQPEAGSLSLAQLLHLGLAESSCAPLVKGLELWPLARGFLHLSHICPDPFIWVPNWVWYIGTFWSGPNKVASPVDGVVPDLSLAVVECHQLLSLLGSIWGPVAEGVVGHWALLHLPMAPSGHSKKMATLAGNCGALPRVIWKVKLHLFLCWIQGWTLNGRPWWGMWLPSCACLGDSRPQQANLPLLGPLLLWLQVQAAERVV